MMNHLERYAAVIFCLFLFSGCSAIRDRIMGTPQKPCIMIRDYPGKSEEDLRRILEQEARQKYLEDYLQKLYSVRSPSFVIPTGEAREELLQKIYFFGEKEFYSGPQFGQLCLRARPVLDEKSLEPFRIRRIYLKPFCYRNPDARVKDVKEAAVNAAASMALKDLDPELKGISPAEAVKLVHSAEIRQPAFDLEGNQYCFEMRGFAIPWELENYRKRLKAAAAMRRPEVKAIPPLSSFRLNLSQQEVGDLAKAFGRDIYVKKGLEGKALGTFRDEGADLNLALHPGSDFSITFLMYYERRDALIRAGEKVSLMSLHYDNLPVIPDRWKDALWGAPLPDFNPWENVEWELKVSGNDAQARFFMEDYSTDFDPIRLAENYNEIGIVKKGDELRFSWNGSVKFVFRTQGINLTRLTLPLGRSDLLYSLSVNPLAAP